MHIVCHNTLIKKRKKVNQILYFNEWLLNHKMSKYQSLQRHMCLLFFTCIIFLLVELAVCLVVKHVSMMHILYYASVILSVTLIIYKTTASFNHILCIKLVCGVDLIFVHILPHMFLRFHISHIIIFEMGVIITGICEKISCHKILVPYT